MLEDTTNKHLKQNNMKKQTAVKYLLDEYNELLDNISLNQEQAFELLRIIIKAESLFKEQIIDAWTDGNRQSVYDATETSGERYYNETYNKE